MEFPAHATLQHLPKYVTLSKTDWKKHIIGLSPGLLKLGLVAVS